MNTSANASDFAYVRPWLRDEIFAASLTAISLYLTVVLAIHECTKSRKRNVKEIDSFKKKVEEFLSSGSLCLVAVTFTLVRCLCEQIELRLGRVSDLACRIYQHELVEVYHISLTCLYLLLWTRQLKMYRHRALRHLSSKCLRVLSYFVLVGILGSSIATATSYLVTFTLISSPQGCVYRPFKDGPPSSLPGILLFLIAFIFQFALLGLLVYPLLNHYEVRMCCQTAAPSGKNHKNIRETILRLTICTTICVISDGVSSNMLAFLHDSRTPLMFWANIYTVNLLFNIVAVICSFADWKKRLFPCCKADNHDAVQFTSATSGSSAV